MQNQGQSEFIDRLWRQLRMLGLGVGLEGLRYWRSIYSVVEDRKGPVVLCGVRGRGVSVHNGFVYVASDNSIVKYDNR